jgi:mycothiol synthase
MEKHPIKDKSDIQKMRALIAALPGGPTVTDFEEHIQLSSVQKNTRLWMDKQELVAFAYVDDYNNLCFEILPGYATISLEQEIVTWGVECMELRNRSSQETSTLDACCTASNRERISILERSGFTQDSIRTLHFTRDLTKTIQHYTLPDGFTIRVTTGEPEIDKLVDLHKAAFESDQMTIEYRRAIMAGLQYEPNMDWVVVAPNGELAAFCLGSFDENNKSEGYLDPIGVHPGYWQKGLGAAIVTYGLQELKNQGVSQVKLGTSSENIGMQQLARKMGFEVASESLWFSKIVS